MTVFKASMKIFKRNWLLLSIYFLIFALMSLSMGIKAEDNANAAFETSNVKVSVINNDSSRYGESLENYLDKNTKLVDIVDSDEGIADALFYRYTEYIIRIPEGFGEKLEAGENVSIDKYQVAGSYSGVFMDNMINNYISGMKIYGADVPDINDTRVEIISEDKGENDKVYLFNFSAYSLMAIIILGVGALLATFNRADIRMRNLVSPVSGVRMSIIQIGACLFFMVIVWLLMTVAAVGIIGADNIQTADIYMIANTFIYAVVSLSIGFCIGTIIRSENGRTIATNVIALGFCFIGGVMIPVSMQGDSVKIIGSFTPTYWFTTANEALAGADKFTLGGLTEAWQAMAVEILFAVAFIAVGLAALRKRAD